MFLQCKYLDALGEALSAAWQSAAIAAIAIDDWERGGSAGVVTRTAAVAKHKGEIAIEALVADEPWTETLDDPETRRGRLGYAAWLMLLAGTDEHGRSSDLRHAAILFEQAAQA